MPEFVHHHHSSEADRSHNNHNLEELFESARSLWNDGELKKSWGVYERICDMLKPDPHI